MIKGRVVSFDRIKGYGFVAPETGGEDVFIHVNDLYSDKSLLGPGSVVEFRLEEGERGPKASAVTVLQPPPESAAPAPAAHPPTGAPLAERPAAAGEEDCDVLSADEFEHEFTELLLRVEPELTGRQILDIRRRLLGAAQSHGWSDR